MKAEEELKPIDISKYKITETGQVLKRTKDEMKDKISMALKDPVLQQGFEIICKENAELDCQMNRNKYCHSCVNATDRCFRKEIGCPCEKYKSYKDENAELKDFIKDLFYENHNTCLQFSNTTCLFNSDYRNRAEELIGEKL